MTWQTKITGNYDSLKSIYYLLIFLQCISSPKTWPNSQIPPLGNSDWDSHPKNCMLKASLGHENKVSSPKFWENRWLNFQNFLKLFVRNEVPLNLKHATKKKKKTYVYICIYIYMCVNICLYTYNNLIAIFWSTNQWPGKSQSSSLQY